MQAPHAQKRVEEGHRGMRMDEAGAATHPALNGPPALIDTQTVASA